MASRKFSQKARIEMMQKENERKLANATELLNQRLEFIESDVAEVRRGLASVSAGERVNLVGLGTPFSRMADFQEVLTLVNKMLEVKCDLEFIASGAVPKN